MNRADKTAKLAAVHPQIRAWWSTPIDHDAQIEYFAQRGLLGMVQLLIGACCAALATAPVIIQFSPYGPGTPMGRAIGTVFAISTMAWALVWWFGPWPNRVWSSAFLVYANIGVTAVAFTVSNPLAGLLGLNVFALTAVYAKFFQGPRMVALHMVWVLFAVGAFGLWVGAGWDGDGYLAAAGTIAAIASLVTTPIVIHFGLWVLRNEANDSLTDHLTGLLNRRGLNLQIGSLVRSRGTVDSPDTVLMVMVIDLDRFKHINDTHGHAVGDEVLKRSAHRITGAVHSEALVARVGGEEFVVAAITAARHIPRIGERVRLAIEADADQAPVTASVGVAMVPLGDFIRPGGDPAAFLGAAVDCADRAMFEAKRKGGNATTHCLLPVEDSGPSTCRCVGQTSNVECSSVARTEQCESAC
ncbi:GGDEF domain-containing protein [Mycolicibacterium mucogenicum]|uniref:GGDEF domain-containing protein n=1 Tax=Mycolicibacterium mucogenicum TaxID=56689 RepID=UPI00226A6EA8|nr:GGDEF domain-containing protein [Mycolicibacterium mucogenicum]MCX8553802.1 GGDEF domain-containing protein [Mycolicibacterium mucogenicum]